MGFVGAFAGSRLAWLWVGVLYFSWLGCPTPSWCWPSCHHCWSSRRLYLSGCSHLYGCCCHTSGGHSSGGCHPSGCHHMMKNANHPRSGQVANSGCCCCQWATRCSASHVPCQRLLLLWPPLIVVPLSVEIAARTLCCSPLVLMLFSLLLLLHPVH